MLMEHASEHRPVFLTLLLLHKLKNVVLQKIFGLFVIGVDSVVLFKIQYSSGAVVFTVLYKQPWITITSCCV